MYSEKKMTRLAAVITLVLLAGVGPGTGVSAGNGDPASPDHPAAAESDRMERQVILYYFHGTRRCKTCRTIEAYAQRAVKTKFKDQLQDGKFRWEALNTDEAANAHFLKDFGLVSSSLVVVEMNGGQVIRHSVLQDAWTLVRDEPRFIQYVQRSVQEYLK